MADVVVVDAPPVLAAADATILGTYADGAVLVTTVDKSVRPALEAASERLRVSGVTIFGVVLTGVRGRRRTSYASSYGAEGGSVARHAAAALARVTAPDEQSGPSVPVDAADEHGDRSTRSLVHPRPTPPQAVPEDGTLSIPVPSVDGDGGRADEVVAGSGSVPATPA